MVMVVSTAGMSRGVRFDPIVSGWETGRSEAEEKAIRDRKRSGSESADAYREAILSQIAAERGNKGGKRQA